MSLFGSKREDEAGGRPPGDPASEAGTAGGPAKAGPEKHIQRGAEGQMTNIGKSIAIKGDLTGSEDIVIEGSVEGKVDLPSNQLTIGANGTAKAEIAAKTVVVVGRVNGNVRGTERVEIQASGMVEGDVTSPRLIVAEGAVINGTVHMTKKEGAGASQAAAVPSAKPPTPTPPPPPIEGVRRVG